MPSEFEKVNLPSQSSGGSSFSVAHSLGSVPHPYQPAFTTPHGALGGLARHRAPASDVTSMGGGEGDDTRWTALERLSEETLAM